MCKPNRQVTLDIKDEGDICKTCRNNNSNLMLVSNIPFALRAPPLLYNVTLSLMCYLFHVKAKTEGNGDSSSSNGHHARLVNGNTAAELNPVT